MEMTMRNSGTLQVVLALFLLGSVVSGTAQDTVTIPKSRLKELEQKEKELDKLKSGQRPGTDSPRANPQLAPKPAEPVVKTPPPALASLPPFIEGQTMEAIDLAGFYRQDAVAADQRFRKRKMVLHGEIAAFEKPTFRRNYRVIFQGADRDARVICDLLPPDEFSAVFTVKDGSQLVGVRGETRIPIVQIGQSVFVEGTCKGLRGSTVMVLGTKLRPVP